MPHWLEAIILGLVEGITEFIPVSSTAHLLISEKILGLKESDLFNIVIQSGAVLAIIPLFWRQFCGMTFGLADPKNRDLLTKIVVAFGITSVGMLILEKRGLKLPEELKPVAWALLVGGVVIFLVEAISKRRMLEDAATWPVVIIAFGLCQIVAGVFPGASRSGATIMAAMLLGMSRPAATEFTFLLGVPTLLAAGGWKLLKAVKAGDMHGAEWLHISIGFAAAAISSFVVVKWLIRYVQSHTFNSFAVYRVVAGAALLLWLIRG
ncbi:MAG TPA: undecaprenyl-diphosphate phosphatase [Verrucomicrobiaceae bacterium]